MELKASESDIIDDVELQDARRTMTEDEYNQEYECSWSAAIKGAYYAKELAECREKRILR
jgi:phage terminase large subunit